MALLYVPLMKYRKDRLNLKENLTFEECIKKLEIIAEKLESGETSLEESISLYEEGMKLSKECSKILGQAQQKIITLTEAEGKSDD